MFTKLRESPVSPVLLITTVVGGIVVLIGSYKLSSVRAKKRKPTVPYASIGMLQAVKAFGGINAPWIAADLAREARKNGRKCFRVAMPMPFANYYVGDHNLIRKILSDPLSDKPFIYKIMNGIVGSDNSIFTSPNNSHWKMIRKATALAFSTSEVSRMNIIALQCTREWCDYAESIYSSTAFDPLIEMVKLTFKIICQAGLEYEATDEDFHMMHDSLAKSLPEYCARRTSNPARILVAWLLPEAREAARCSKRIQDFAAKVLHAYRDNPNKSQQNTLIKIIASRDSLSEKQKIAEIVIFMLAGHDTSGITISSVLVLLGRHPDKLKKLWKDTDRLLPSQWPTSSTYYKYIIKESQRIMPTAAMGSIRTLGQDYDTGINGEVMLKGSIVHFPQIIPNYDDTIYDEPEVFNPDRWYNATPDMNDAFLPFSIGPRNCVGKALAIAEVDTILPVILSRFDISLIKDAIPKYFLTLKCVGAQVQLTKL